MKIKFGGKERGFQWGTGCIEKYCELMGGDLETLAELDSTGIVKIKASVNLLLAAMVHHCELNDQSVDFTYSKVSNWLDEADQGTMDILMTDFLKSKFLGKTIEGYFSITTENTGKKVTKQRTKKTSIA